jgi:hypothetical protein
MERSYPEDDGDHETLCFQHHKQTINTDKAEKNFLCFNQLFSIGRFMGGDRHEKFSSIFSKNLLHGDSMKNAIQSLEKSFRQGKRREETEILFQ